MASCALQWNSDSPARAELSEFEDDAKGNHCKLHYLTASTGLFAIFVQEKESIYYFHKPASLRGEDYPPMGGQVLGSFQSITD